VPYTEDADTIPVRVNRLERLVLRNALDTHRKKLEKVQKDSDDAGVPNADAGLHLSVIDGTEGWGQSLVSKFSGAQTHVDEEARERAATVDGQLSIVDEAGANEQDEALRVFIETRNCIADKLLEIPTLGNASDDFVRTVVLAWSPAQAKEAADFVWALEVNADAPLPVCVSDLFDRIEEAEMTNDEVAFWLDMGPWLGDGDRYEGTETPFFYAAIMKSGKVDQKHTTNFETREEAVACAARLNRDNWKIEHPDATVTPWDAGATLRSLDALEDLEDDLVPAIALGDPALTDDRFIEGTDANRIPEAVGFAEPYEPEPEDGAGEPITIDLMTELKKSLAEREGEQSPDPSTGGAATAEAQEPTPVTATATAEPFREETVAYFPKNVGDMPPKGRNRKKHPASVEAAAE
jgi:hypothetical protein